VPLEPSEPQGKSRIILPGSDPGLDDLGSEEGSDAAPERSRIVLPPGVSVEEEEEGLPEYPKLRPLEILPVRSGEQDMILVSDPQGVFRAPIALRFEVLDLLQLLDGTLSLGEISTLVARESKDVRAARFVRDLIAQLDRLLLLDSPRFHEAYDTQRRDYHRLEVRQAAFEGISYPGDPREAEAFLASHFEKAAATRPADVATAASNPRALMVPHLDPRRAGVAIARSYLELDPAATEPLRVIVYGVGHALVGDLLALTRKHFETPFGQLPCDTIFVDAVASQLGEAAYRSELAHRDEHSIEFQALYLRYRFRTRPVTIVPILCGGLHGLQEQGKGPEDAAELEALIEAVRDTERTAGGTTVHVAGVDLSHVGERFGDPAPDERTLREVEEKDRAAIEAACRGDARGWYEAVAAHQDSTRICGWAATYVMLRCATPGEGRLLLYEQSREAASSLVSIASLAWP
jgi:AmmeMemoRadiSam system protein B